MFITQITNFGAKGLKDYSFIRSANIVILSNPSQ